MSDKPQNKNPSWKERLKKAYDTASKKGKELYDEGRKNAAPLLEEGKKKAGELYEDAKKNAGETLETLGTLADGKEGDKPAQDLTLKERLNAAKEKVKDTDWNAVVKDTAREITKKDELKKLAGSIIILPGGLAVYGAYRVAKHHREKEAEQSRLKKDAPANEDKTPGAAAPEDRPSVVPPVRKPRKPRPPRPAA